MESGFNDVFISYGRRESKAFATRLHGRLSANGYKVWFDQNDIPLGVDFQNQIDEGIEKADTFVFIIAPHAVKSPYCLKEIELAVKLKKRIIPILQVEPTDCWDKMHPVIAKLNWIYMREEFVEGIPLEELKPLDDFDAGIEGLLGLLSLHKDYVKQHTQILNLALNWERHQKNTEYLLVGKERQEAEAWLLTEFKDVQAPCKPTDLHAEYLCASKKNAENLFTDVFISYSERDKLIREKIIRSLSKRLVTAWVHHTDIRKGEAFEEAIFQGIEQADNVLFFISEDSIRSEWCIKELEYAKELHKRVIPVLIEEISPKNFPEQIRGLQYINFVDNVPEEDYDNDIAELLNTLGTDRRYFHQHKVFLAQALKWQRQAKNPSILLRGYNLQNAETWFKLGQKRKGLRPLPIHEEFIEESKRQAGSSSLEVFVSYSRKDSDFARKLDEQLTLSGKTTWFDQDSIAEGADFQQEIYNGIEQSDNFLFIISPSSIASPYCADEVEYAVKLGKRILTVNHRFTEPETMPAALAAVQWIDFEKQDFAVAFSQLVRTLDTDREHVQRHSKWQNRALEWEAKDKSDDLLLRGNELAVASAWLDEAQTHKKKPVPTPLQKAFLKASDEHANAAFLKQKRQNFVLRALLVLAVMALGVAVWQVFEAKSAKKKAEDAKDMAIAALKQAEREKERAERAKDRADASEEEARLAESEALANAERADSSAQYALEQQDFAFLKAAEARRSAQEAFKSAAEADSARQEAKQNEFKAVRSQFFAELSKERARLNELQAIAREAALKSISRKDNDEIKPTLALVSYKVFEQAQSNATISFNALKKSFAEFKEATPKERKDFNREAQQMQGDIRKALPAEVFEALQKAHDAGLAGQEGNFPEMWSMPVTQAGQILYGSSQGVHLYTLNQGQIPARNAGRKIGAEVSPLKANYRAPGTGTFTGHSNGKVYLLPTQEKALKEVADIKEPVLSLAYLPKTLHLLVLGNSGEVYQFAQEGLAFRKVNEDIAWPQQVKVICPIDHQGEEGVLLGANKLFHWQPSTNEVVSLYTPQGEGVQALAFNDMQNTIALGTTRGKVFFLSLGKQKLSSGQTLRSRVLDRFHRGLVRDLAFSFDGKHFCSVGLDKQLLLWKLGNGKPELILTLRSPQRFLSVNFSPKNDYVYYSDARSLRLIPTTAERLRSLLCQQKPRALTPTEREQFVGGNLPEPFYKTCDGN